MFCCCRHRRENPTVSQHPPLPASPPSLSPLIVSPASSSPPPPPSPVSEIDDPDLTPDEITRVQTNLDNLQDWLFQIYTTNGNIIGEVENMLQTPEPIPDPQSSLWCAIFETSLGVIGTLATPILGPSAEIIATVLGGTVDYVTNNSEAEAVTGDEFDHNFGKMLSRLNTTYDAVKKWLAFLKVDPNLHRNFQFTIPVNNYPPLKGVVHTLRDLANIKVPTADDTLFADALQDQNRSFRYSVTGPEFKKKHYWRVYFVQELAYSGSCFGNAFAPTGNYNPAPRRCAAPGNNGLETNPTLRIGKMNNDGLGKGTRIFSTDEISHHHPEYVHAESFGKDDCSTQDEYISNFKAAVNDFVTKFPSAHVGPYTIDKEANEIRYYRWFIMCGQNEIQDGSQSGPINHKQVIPAPGSESFTLADGGFLQWLFIDDGVGNIVNKNGVGYRDDIIRNWTENGYQIPPTTTGF